MQQVNEIFMPKRMAASGQVVNQGGSMGGLFCVTGGTVQIRNGPTVSDSVIVDTFSVVSGTYYPLPFAFPNGAYVEITTAVVVFGING